MTHSTNPPEPSNTGLGQMGAVPTTGGTGTEPWAPPPGQGTAGMPSDTTGAGSGSSGRVEAAKDATADVKDTAVEAGQQVAVVAKEEATEVVKEAIYDLRQLLRQAADEAGSQASAQQQRLAESLHSLAKELGSMASSSHDSGPMTSLVQQASHKGGELAHWLESHEPRDLLYEVKSFARRRPVTFLAAATAAGIVAGRLGKGMAGNHQAAASQSEPRRGIATSSQSSYLDEGVPGGTATGLGTNAGLRTTTGPGTAAPQGGGYQPGTGAGPEFSGPSGQPTYPTGRNDPLS